MLLFTLPLSPSKISTFVPWRPGASGRLLFLVRNSHSQLGSLAKDCPLRSLSGSLRKMAVTSEIAVHPSSENLGLYVHDNLPREKEHDLFCPGTRKLILQLADVLVLLYLLFYLPTIHLPLLLVLPVHPLE